MSGIQRVLLFFTLLIPSPPLKKDQLEFFLYVFDFLVLVIWNKTCLIFYSPLFLNLKVFLGDFVRPLTQVSSLTLRKCILYRVAL